MEMNELLSPFKKIIFSVFVFWHCFNTWTIAKIAQVKSFWEN